MIRRPSIGLTGGASSTGSGMNLSASIDTSGYDRLQANFAKFSERIRLLPGMIAKGTSGGPSIVSLLKRTTPKSAGRSKGGHLANRWVYQEDRSERFSTRGYIYNTSDRAFVLKFLEEGTKPHVIHGNPFLRFQWKGETRFFRKVDHPGTKGRWFIKAAVKEADERARKIVNAELAKLGGGK